MRTLLVTGGAGFIGSNFVRLALADPDVAVVVVDNLTYAGHLENLADFEADPRFRFVRADIADADAVGKLLAEVRPQAILNFAAETHVDRSIDSPRPFISSNIQGTFELLEAARLYLKGGAGTNDFRFLHVSTDEVFGSLGTSGRFEETTPYAPRSPYAASKAAADHLARAYYYTYDLPILVTNCSNNYGPWQLPEKLIPLVILKALGGENLPIYGDGSNVRDWIFVEDHCRGLLRVLERGEPGETFNLGANCEQTNLQIVTAICSILESRRPSRSNAAMVERGLDSYIELLTFVDDRPGHDRRYAIDATKAREELGWQASTDLQGGLEATIDWYLDNQAWCEAVQAEGLDGRRLGLLAPQP